MKRFLFIVLALAMSTPAFGGGEVFLDFDSEPPIDWLFGTSEWREEGGNGGGYLSITDAENSQHGWILIEEDIVGEALETFTIRADLRVGGGTDRPADGFSFNFAREDDEFVEDPENPIYNGSPNGNEASLPEEGTRTGLAIGFDEWDSGAPDVVGMSIHFDGEILDQIEMPVLNGELDDDESLQTGPADTDADDLGWAPFEIQFDANKRLQISYKNRTVFDDIVSDFEPYSGRFIFAGRTGGANANHHVDNLFVSFNQGAVDPCDFDGNGVVDVADLNLLLAEVKAGTGAAAFDITGDGSVDQADINSMVEDPNKFNSFVGDANLDGEFNSSDFVSLFTAGEYNDGVAMNSTWSTGDFNGDGEFDSGDLVTAFTWGGDAFEAGPRAATAAVPEPSSAVLLLIGALALIRRRK